MSERLVLNYARVQAIVTSDECVLAIANGEVIGGSDIASAAGWFTADPDVTEVVRMPASALAHFLFEPWPGREAALAALAQGGHHEA